MHIPDGFLDGKTAVATAVVSLAGVGFALREAGRRLPPRRVPLLGLTAAFIFAAQMLNFPVLGGTSGHLMGAVLVAALLGPAAAVVVMTAVLLVQCFLFADGGVLALGANVLNMALVAPLAGYALYAALRRLLPGERGRLVAVAVAAWGSTLLAAMVCAGELAWSGTVRWAAAFPAMTGVHLLIGLGEGAITTLVIVAIRRARPELLPDAAPLESRAGGRGALVYGLLLSAALALFVAPFACPWPDGLESVAARLGFDRAALTAPLLAAPLADYRVPGLPAPGLATALAGLLGTLIVFGLALALARALHPRGAGAPAATGSAPAARPARAPSEG